MNAILDAHDLPPPTEPEFGAEQRRAAFFGLDKTLIHGSSLFLVAQGLHQRDFFRTREIARFAWEQYRSRGVLETAPQVESSTNAALEFVAGRRRPDIEALAREITHERIVPRVFPDIAKLIEQHRCAGDLTFVATAAPAEVAQVVAEGLGMTGSLGTRAEVDDAQRYSGRLEGSVLRGAAKASAVEAHAATAGINLNESVAYSDSINDLPLLELVGRPAVVNPDDKLRRVADDRGWPVHDVEGPKRDRRQPTVVVHDRFRALGLESSLRPAGMAPSGRTHHFKADDPEDLLRQLEASGRFRRDTRLGALFHRGEISLREVAQRRSLHVTFGEDNRVSAHVDHISPLASSQPDDGCRYSLPRIAAHNMTGMAGDLVRLVSRRNRGHTDCCPETETEADAS
ncbi:MAG: HAD family hydrolase [Acidimicrobiales bacterium]